MSLPVTPLCPAQQDKQMAEAGREGYVKRLLVGFDQFVNVVANGHPGETISARSARAAVQGKVWGKAMSVFLNVFQKDHGAKATAGDLERAKIIDGLEKQSGLVK